MESVAANQEEIMNRKDDNVIKSGETEESTPENRQDETAGEVKETEEVGEVKEDSEVNSKEKNHEEGVEDASRLKESPIIASGVNDNTPPPSPVPNEEEIKQKIKTKKMPLIPMDLVHSTLKKAGFILFGYVISFFPWSFVLALIGILSYLWLETRVNVRQQKIASKYAAISMTKQELLQKIDELPAWVTFPDRERAEWLNEIIRQLWPNLNNYIVKLMKGQVQAKIRRKHKGFTFEDVDFGCNPPKIDGVKVYNRSATRDCIIIDFDVFYDGNCMITFSSSGTQLGSIRDFQVSVEVRVVLKPLLVKVPLIGGIQVFFLNTPEINFSLEGISGIPGLSDFIRQKIEERIRRLIVFPNKVAKRFSKTVDAAELKSLEPEGVLRVHVVRAADLEKKDFGGTSDPYAVLTVGAQEHKTHVVKKCVNPRWDYWCEFVILDPTSQILYFKVFDHDELNEDDFLGSGSVDIASVLKEGEGARDRCIELEKVKHGVIFLRFTWLGLTSDYTALSTALREYKLLKVGTISTAVLIIYVDSAQSLPLVKDVRKPDPYLILRLGNQQEKSKVKRHTDDPVWEQGFIFLVNNPETASLYVTIMDKGSDTKLDDITYNVASLLQMPDMQISKEDFFLRNNPPASKIIISLQLRILTNAKFEDEDSDSSPSENEFSPQNSSQQEKSTNSSPISQQSSVENGSVQKPAEPLFEKATVKRTSRTPSFRRRFMQRSFSNHSNISDAPKTHVGRIDLTLEYNDMRQKLIITIHKVMNLPLKDPDDIPDPYVTLKLISPFSNSVKHRTKAYMDTCDPVFNETFEYLLSQPELMDNKLIASVKTKKFFKYKNAIGHAVISLKSIDLREPYRACFDLYAEFSE